MPPKQGREKGGKEKGPQWDENHPARKLLYKAIADDKLQLNGKEMGPKQVYEKYKGESCFQLKGMEYGPTFSRRLRDLRTIVKRNKDRGVDNEGEGKEEQAWKNHPARKLLYADLANGRLELDGKEMGPQQVYEKYKGESCFQLKGMEYGPNFTRRLRDLREIVKRDKSRAIEDKQALAISIRNHPVPEKNHKGEPQWNGSAAQQLLKVDMEAGKHKFMKPSDLRKTRPEYQLFLPDTFRWKIQQNIRTEKFLYTLKIKADKKLKKTQKGHGTSNLNLKT